MKHIIAFIILEILAYFITKEITIINFVILGGIIIGFIGVLFNLTLRKENEFYE